MAKRKQRNPKPEVEVAYERGAMASTIKAGIGLLLATQLVVYAVLVVNHGILRFRSAGGAWPTHRDVLTDWTLATAPGVLLLGACTCLWLAGRAARLDRPRPIRLWVLAATVLCVSSLGFRFAEYRARFANGVYPRSPRPMLYDRADIFYIQAVREELKQRYSRLDDKLRLEPDQFTEQDRFDLERIAQLQTDMIGWTELDLALRSGDVQEKQARMETVAYQIHPLESLRSRVDAFVAAEKELLSSLRERLELLKDYFSSKSRLQRELRELERASPAANGPSEDQADASDARQRIVSELEQLDQQYRSRLPALSGDDRSALISAMGQSSDWSATTQLAKQLDTQLGHVEGRQRFLAEAAAANAEGQEFRGLNLQSPWLKLPVFVPGGNRWASSYFLLTGVHTLHLLIATGLLLMFLPQRVDANRSEWFAAETLIVQGAAIAWLVVFAVTHFF